MAEKQLTYPATYNLHTFGLFNKSPFLAPGDPYVEPSSLYRDHDNKGLKNIVTSHGKTGLDATFEGRKYKPLFSTGEYVEADTLLEHQRVESGRKRISDKPFRPTSPTKKGSGKGSAYGYLGKIPPNLLPGDPYQEPSVIPRRDEEKGLKNIVRVCGRTGSQATIGKKFEWMADPYGGDVEKRTRIFGDDVKYNQSILRSRPSSASERAKTENLPSSRPRPATARPQSTGVRVGGEGAGTRRQRPTSARTVSEGGVGGATWRSPLVSTRAFAPYGGPPRLFDKNVFRDARPSSATTRASSASASASRTARDTHYKHPHAFCGTSYTGRTFSKYPEHIPDPEKAILKGQAHSEKGFMPAGTTDHSLFTRPIMTHVTRK